MRSMQHTHTRTHQKLRGISTTTASCIVTISTGVLTQVRHVRPRGIGLADVRISATPTQNRECFRVRPYLTPSHTFHANHNRIGSIFPLNGVKESHAERFLEFYQLPIEKDVFVRGVLAVRSRDEIEARFKQIADQHANDTDEKVRPVELQIGTHKYTRLETEVLYNAWTRGKKATLMNLSRLHRLLIFACIYAAMTQ
jgi:hypothetical protein